MTRSDWNNLILAIAIGLIGAGGFNAVKGTDILPDWPVWPTPSPVDPVVPDNPNGALGKLVPDKGQRKALKQIFTDMASLVESDATVITSTDQLRTMQNNGGMLLMQNGKWPSNDAFRAALDDRMTKALGLESKPITPADRTSIVAFYRSLAAEF